MITKGHLDLVEVTVSGGRLVVSTKDHTTPGGPSFRAPTDLQVRIPDRARTEVPPGSAFAFLGPAGSRVHLLPQTEDPDLVWPGWSTERMRPGQVAGDVITWRLRSVEGPGSFALFTTDQFGSPSVIFDDDGGGPKETAVRINTHAHANWAFGAPGAYQLAFEVAADVPGVGQTATTATYVFLVGDATAPVDPRLVSPPQEGVTPSELPLADASTPDINAGGSPSTSSGPQGSAGGADGDDPAGVAGSSTSGSTNGDSTGASGDVALTGSLARTGSSAIPGVLLGSFLLLGGAVTVAVAGRRRLMTRAQPVGVLPNDRGR